MNKKVLAVIIMVVVSFIAILTLSGFGQPEFKKLDVIYHVTLADPGLYKEGIYADSFVIQKGSYSFRFIPNGDSPKTLSVTLTGNSFSFLEDFKLAGTPHETGISVYYTWDYNGKKQFEVLDDQDLKITINPHDDIQGPVSFDMIKVRK